MAKIGRRNLDLCCDHREAYAVGWPTGVWPVKGDYRLLQEEATMTSSDFYQLVAGRFDYLCKTYSLKMPTKKSFILKLSGPEVFLVVAYNAFRSKEVAIGLGSEKGLMHPQEPEFDLTEVLRAAGHYELPEANGEIVASWEKVGEALSRVAELLAQYGDKALRGDRVFFEHLEKQRHLDSVRYQYDRPLLRASRSAYQAWSKGEFGKVVILLSPFRERLTDEEKNMLESALRGTRPQPGA